MAQVKLEEEEQELWEQKMEHSVVQEFEEKPESRDIQSVEEASSVLQCTKEEAEFVVIKVEPEFLPVSVTSEEGEPQFSLLHQTVTEEDRAGAWFPPQGGGIKEEAEEPCSSDSEWSWEFNSQTEPKARPKRPMKTLVASVCEKELLPEFCYRKALAERSTSLNKSQRRKINRLNTPKKHKCSHCEFAFRHLSELKIHLRTHTGEKPFKCPICERRFSVKKSLKPHMRVHTGERPFKCTKCNKRFKTKTGLWFHGYRIQGCADGTPSAEGTKEKNHACPRCGKRFRDINALKVHDRTHTGEKPFKCPICEKRFIVKGALTQHMRVHTGERPFKCTNCKKGFKTKTNLTYHRNRVQGCANEVEVFGFSELPA